MNRKLALIVAAIVALGTLSAGAAIAAAGLGGPPPLPQGSEPVKLDPADFVARIDNPYWPMTPGSRWVYREPDGEGNVFRVEVTVMKSKKTILGLDATVVHDVVTGKGRLVEDTYDWYAQDKWGNVWYLGEDTKEYKNGKVVSTEGSWEAGVDGAQAGVVMPAKPEVGLTYRQEYYAGQAEDAAKILSIDEQVEVPFGHFDEVVMTKDYTPLTPDALEYKFYAKGTGPRPRACGVRRLGPRRAPQLQKSVRAGAGDVLAANPIPRPPGRLTAPLVSAYLVLTALAAACGGGARGDVRAIQSAGPSSGTGACAKSAAASVP